MERRVVVYVCDLCKTEDLVSTHTMAVDGTVVEFEACDGCWARMLGMVAEVAKNGRKPAKTKKVSGKNEFPGLEGWKFSDHALIRLGERKIRPHHACRAAQDPEETYPGLQPDLQVRIRGDVKVVVRGEDQYIVTAVRRDDEVDAVR